MIFLEEVTPSAVADVDLTAFDKALYERYMVMGWLRPATDSVDLRMRVFNSAGVVTSTNYLNNVLSTRNNSDGSGLVAVTNQTFWEIGFNIGNTTSEQATFRIWLESFHNTNVVSSFQGQMFHVDQGSIPNTAIGGGFYNTPEDNDSLKFFFAAGNIAAGKISLYGVKRI